MTSELKEMRERMCLEYAQRPLVAMTTLGSAVELSAFVRRLQYQAMIAAVRQVACVQLLHDGHELCVKAYSAVALDMLLDDQDPQYPVRCIHCGMTEAKHAATGHVFEANSLRCYRAHPHPEPCASAEEDGQ